MVTKVAERAGKKALTKRKPKQNLDAQTVEKKSARTKMPVSKTDIMEATTANELDALQRRLDGMKDGNIKKAMQLMLDKQRKSFEKKQSDDVDKMQRKQQQTARDKKMKGKVTLPDMPFAKGGMAKKSYNKGGYANCGASMKATQKSTNMMYGGMSRKK